MHFVSHTGQDQWAVETLRGKRSGYFLDFGGFDGLQISNTFYMEKFLGWKGILVEPNPVPYSSSCALRSCITINAALWNESRQSLQFMNSHGLSSIIEYKDCDVNSEKRNSINEGIIEVDTINPTELLDRFKAPKLIDFMSLDVEGAELVVLQAIDLTRYRIALMAIEHNNEREKQNAIREHLSNFGYEVIGHHNDDLFFNRVILNELTGNNYTDPVEVQKRILNVYNIRF